MQIIAIIGPTCSGKSALALNLALKINAYIFSIDSLSIYKEIDIASAKPSKNELESVRHYAINALFPNEHVNVGIFIKLLESTLSECKKDCKNLVIVGGSSFYLKSIIQGLSKDFLDSKKKSNIIESNLPGLNLSQKYDFLAKIDSNYASKISRNDTYRIHRGLEIFFYTKLSPTQYFTQNKRQILNLNMQIFNLQIDKKILREQINARTNAMLKAGLIDEVKGILDKYGRDIQPFKAIGLKETLLFFEGKISLEELENLISTHTRQLAKRQITFNKTQIPTAIPLDSNNKDNVKVIMESSL